MGIMVMPKWASLVKMKIKRDLSMVTVSSAPRVE